MTLKRHTAFDGIPYEDTRPSADVINTDADTIAGDDAMTYEVMTGKNADGTGSASVNDAHRHISPDSMRLWRPFMTHAWGSQGPDDAAGTNDVLSLITTKGTTAGKGQPTVIWASLQYFGSAWVNHFIEMLVTGDSTSADGTLGITIVVSDDTMTEVYRTTLLPFGDVDGIDNGATTLNRALFQVALPGLYVVQAQVDINDEDRQMGIYQMSMSPTFRIADRDVPQPSTPALPYVGSNVATVPAWQPIDDRLTTADFPLGPALLLLAQNQNALYELATGLEAPGNVTATDDGHDHDGSNSPGISYNVLSIPFGSNEDDAELSGNGAHAPYVDVSEVTSTPTPLRVVRNFFAQMPTSTLTVGGATSKLKAAILAHCALAGTGKLGVDVTSATDAALGHACRFTQTTTGFQVIKVATLQTSIGFTSGAMEKFQIEMRSTASGPTAKPRLVSLCLYFEE